MDPRTTAPHAGPGPAEDAYRGFSVPELQRYARHFALEEVGPEGQRALKEARVLLVGAGGLGSPAALYLAAAGVGTLGVIDPDVVDLSNLQRQVLHGTPDLGRPKVESARDRIGAVNPHVRVEAHPVRLTSANAREVVAGYDLVIDGSDNFPTRYLVNDACVLSGRPWVYGAILRWEGQVALFGARGGPCYRCLFAEPPPPGLVPGCAEAGVVGVLPGIVGSLQALEAVKRILGKGRGMAGRLLVFDALELSFREIALRRRIDCPVCGDAPTIRELVDYEHFCATGETRAAAEPSAEGPLEPGPAVAEGTAAGPGRAAGTDPVDGPAGPSGEAEIEIAPGEVADRLRSAGSGPGLLLLDVREPWEWAVSNLSSAGARHLPLGELARGIEDLPRDRDVVVYCRTGMRSEEAARLLRERGFANARSLAGGLRRWAEEIDSGLPVA
jgi:sulfur-carrier protein adenylyltransferase/sulfurtransferase